VVAAAVLGVVVVAAFWWLYFDVVAIVAERRLLKASEGRERNEIARDSYSFLHLPMVAGIALVAVGLKKTLGEVGDPLGLIPAAAMLGGAATYLVAHVAFRWRNLHTLNRQRLLCATLLLAMLLLEVAVEPPSLVTLAALAALLVALIAYEALRFAELRGARALLGRGSGSGARPGRDHCGRDARGAREQRDDRPLREQRGGRGERERGRHAERLQRDRQREAEQRERAVAAEQPAQQPLHFLGAALGVREDREHRRDDRERREQAAELGPEPAGDRGQREHERERAGGAQRQIPARRRSVADPVGAHAGRERQAEQQPAQRDRERNTGPNRERAEQRGREREREPA
jgi:hypothetical protein